MSTHIDAADPTVAKYVASLKPISPSKVVLAELVHTLYDAAELETFAHWQTTRDRIDGLRGVYRDGLGTLVVHAADGDYVLVWPARPVLSLTGASRIEGSNGHLFVFGDVPYGVMPLPLASRFDRGFGWGYSGHGPSALYRALLRLVIGDVPERYDTEYLVGRDGGGLYHWIESQFDWSDPFHAEWPDLVRRVRAEMVWRRAVDELRARAEQAERE